MGRCVRCTYGKFCRKHARIRLVERNSLHPCMWLNPYIIKCYRPCDLPWSLCVKSIFQLNNETINVWSHLVGLLYIGYMQYWTAFCALPAVNAPTTDYIVMGGSMLCSQICMALSSAYHTFGCQNARRRVKWLRADLFGVSLGLLGIYLSGIYTSFYHFPDIQRRYVGCLAVIVLVALSVPLFIGSTTNDDECHHAAAWRRRDYFGVETLRKHHRARRIGVTHLVYIALALFGIYPSWHWLELHGGLGDPHVMRWLPSLGILFLLVGFAFLFYATLIPERFFPGAFDLFGCSHHWWHALILAAMVYWHDAGVQLLTHYHTAPRFRSGSDHVGGAGDVEHPVWRPLSSNFHTTNSTHVHF